MSIEWLLILLWSIIVNLGTTKSIVFRFIRTLETHVGVEMLTESSYDSYSSSYIHHAHWNHYKFKNSKTVSTAQHFEVLFYLNRYVLNECTLILFCFQSLIPTSLRCWLWNFCHCLILVLHYVIVSFKTVHVPSMVHALLNADILSLAIYIFSLGSLRESGGTGHH